MIAIICILCREYERDNIFQAPWDGIGKALMEAHLREEHNVTPSE